MNERYQRVRRGDAQRRVSSEGQRQHRRRRPSPQSPGERPERTSSSRPVGKRPVGARPAGARPSAKRPGNQGKRPAKPGHLKGKRPGTKPVRPANKKPANGRNPSSQSNGFQPYTSRKNNTFERFKPLIIAGGIFLVVYLVGLIYYSFHFLPGTIVNGKEVGGMTVSKAESIITQDLGSHTLTLKELERKESIDPHDIDLDIRVDTQIADVCRSQGKVTWIFKLFGTKKKTADLDISYDEKKLEEVIDHLICFHEENPVNPVSARIAPGENEFKIEPEVEGNVVNKTALTEAVKHAFATCATKLDLKKKGLYEKPAIYQDDKRLKKALKTANEFAKTVVNYDFGYTTEVCDFSVFKDWLTINDQFEVIYSDNPLSDYVINLGKKYDTVGVPRTFTNYNGQQVEITEGDYGWKIDYDKERAELNANLKTGETFNRKPIYSSTAMCQLGPANDIGNTYVEVSIDEQMVYLFENGKKVISSPVVTGNVELKRETHKGIYGITYKQRNATLTGEGYSSPVSYWMPFNNNEGLHDAPWRTNFGGYIYMSSGSHGCVNCPPDVAGVIYQHVKKGWPVIVY